MEDDRHWKTTCGGRRPSVEDDLQWKTTFCGRQPSLEDDLLWKTTCGGRRPLLDSCMLPTPLCGIFSIPGHNQLVLRGRMELVLLEPQDAIGDGGECATSVRFF